MPYCNRCHLSYPMNALERDPEHEEAIIPVTKMVQEQDPNNPENVTRVEKKEELLQKPALICIGCMSDYTDPIAGEPFFV